MIKLEATQTTMAPSLLAGKLALTTGGSGTIGVAIAKALAAQGSSVVLTGRSMEKLERAAEKVRETSAPGATIYTISCDVSKEESVLQLYKEIDMIKDGQLDLLVNNAGINSPGATVDLSGADFEYVMKVNVLGPFLCSQQAFKRMKIMGGGRIINIGSLSSASPRPDSAPYTTSKFALQGLSTSLALDGRSHGISVGIINPGNVKSELLSEEVIRERKHEGFLEPKEVADCVVHMASLPYTANVLEMTLLPTPQPFVGRG
jgi:NAD(P)-dependent dehydrogenase (short-subunit alcohol dehydrogenase family)